MKNQLLLYFRKRYNLSPKEVAHKVSISTSKYKQIETGEILMSPAVAKRLSNLYKKCKTEYIYDAACQLDTLHARLAIIRDLRQAMDDLLHKIERLNEEVKSFKSRTNTELEK